MNNTQQKNSNNGHNGQNVWLDFITDNKDFLISFRTRVRKISSALYMMGDLWREEDFGKHLMSVSLQVLEASKIPVTDNKDIITTHFMSVKEVVEYSLSLIIFGAEAGLLATSNVVLVTPFCVALLGDLHDLENTLPTLFNHAKTNRHITDISSELNSLFTKDHTEFSMGSDPIVHHMSSEAASSIVRHPATSSNQQVPFSSGATKNFDLSNLSQMQISEKPEPTIVPIESIIENELAYDPAMVPIETSTDSITRHPTTRKIQPISISDVAKDENNSEIFSIIKEKKTVTPQDLYNIFPDYSTKRVQRELQKLAAEGKIEKKGEKRWVSYHLLSYR